MYTPKDYTHLLGTPGFSDEQLTVHFGLYQGYVKNTNKVAEELKALAASGDLGPSYAERKRRFGWEFDGMRLHEYYFDNLTKEYSPLNPESPLAQALIKEFGSLDAWEKDFRGTGALRGIGWAMLCYDKEAGRLFNIWVNEHDMGHTAGTTALLVMDVFEHAFVFDYGMKRGAYIDAFFGAIDWGEVERRFEG